jgi:hypothetical protein
MEVDKKKTQEGKAGDSWVGSFFLFILSFFFGGARIWTQGKYSAAWAILIAFLLL